MISDNQTLKILIATDCHLGNRESHPIRGPDSFEAFAQVMAIARTQRPDFLLLGGDLFDTVCPSTSTIYRCLHLLRSVVFDDGDPDRDDSIQMEVRGYEPNYLNRNINIQLPIFSIHGNHDCPQQIDSRSAYDILQQSNYINYIGGHGNADRVHVKPIYFLKDGGTKLALYAFGYINTFKLNRLFQRKSLTFEQPEQGSFCILVLHQNRFKGKRQGADYEQCVHVSFLPPWINLIIWCHEHESIVNPTVEQGIRIYQPGSTVATSIIQAEGPMKHVGLLKISGQTFAIQPIYLRKSFRPVHVFQIQLQHVVSKYESQTLQQIIIKETKRMLDQETKKLNNPNGKLPLLRVKVERTGFDTINLRICERQFQTSVANPDEVFKLWRRKVSKQNTVLEKNVDVIETLRKGDLINEPMFEFEQEIIQRMQLQVQQQIKQPLLQLAPLIPKSMPVDKQLVRKQLTEHISAVRRKSMGHIYEEVRARTAKLAMSKQLDLQIVTKIKQNILANKVSQIQNITKEELDSLKQMYLQRPDRYTVANVIEDGLNNYLRSENINTESNGQPININKKLKTEEDIQDKCCLSNDEPFDVQIMGQRFIDVQSILQGEKKSGKSKKTKFENEKEKKPRKRPKSNSKDRGQFEKDI